MLRTGFEPDFDPVFLTHRVYSISVNKSIIEYIGFPLKIYHINRSGLLKLVKLLNSKIYQKVIAKKLNYNIVQTFNHKKNYYKKHTVDVFMEPLVTDKKYKNPIKYGNIFAINTITGEIINDDNATKLIGNE